MEFEFDNEIDAILRKARGGEAVTSVGTHMDADELAAFAENAVPAAARMRYVSHLADCTRCRKILSNVILSNSEAEPEAASSAVAAPATARVPWYRRFFVFPQLAYTMGGAVLVFSAFFGYLIIKNLPGASNSDVSFSTDKAPAAQRQNAANASAPSISTGNSNTATTAATNSNAPSLPSAPATANSAPLSSGNAPVVAQKPAPQEKLNESDVAVVPQATPQAEVKQEDKPFSVDGASGSRDENAKTSPASPIAGATAERRAKEEAEQKKDAPGEDRDDSLSDNKQLAKRKQPSPKAVEKTLSVPGERRTVGGKTFDNIGGIWFDQAVGGRKPKTVRRGSNDYSKLDAGLRSIADQLGGTVVVLWGGKAYRIE